jgi:ethanolamine transporter EutH
MEKDARRHAPTHKLRDRVLHEAKQLLVIFIYLWVMFGLFVLDDRIILRQRGLTFTLRDGFALLNALTLSKVMLVAEEIDLARWIRRGPLIYPILFDALLLSILFICFNILEHVATGLLAHKTLAASVPAIGGGGVVGLVCVAVILFVALTPFIAFRRVSRELGPGRLNAILFGSRTREDR